MARWIVAGVVLCGLLRAPDVRAEDFAATFDGETPSWQPRYDRNRVRVLTQRRNFHVHVEGAASENLEVEASRQGGLLRLEHPVAPARVIEELKLTLWVKSNRPGMRLFLRVILPHEKDPASNGVLSTWIPGSTYEKSGEWQQLSCATTERLVASQLVHLRARHPNRNLDTRGLYVDQAVLSLDLSPGVTEFFLDNLQFGPIVGPREEATVQTASATDETVKPAARMELDNLQVDQKPFFPRIAAFHGENLETLRDAGLNVVWVPDHNDAPLLEQLRQHGLWATATPPRAVAPSGQILDARDAVMAPFSDETAPVLFWMMGTRIPAEAKTELVGWAEQVRAADHRHKRLLAADVTGLERDYSRQVSMLGASRWGTDTQPALDVLHTSFGFRQYREWLIERRKFAQPGSFMWTWIQTEPAPAHQHRRAAAHQHPLVVEPEQLRLQVYAALAAGCRGIGYWKTTPLDGDGPGARERRLMMAQLDLELELLEPWLATGNVTAQVPFEVGRQPGRTGERIAEAPTAPPPTGGPRLSIFGGTGEPAQAPTGEFEAAVIQSNEFGMLLLPVWYGPDAQFVPGRMVANDATIVVNGVPDTASAWEITTTGVRSLARTRDVGGIRITLPKFDQTAAVILTSDRTVIARLRMRIEAMADKSARLSIELARAKLERVRQIDDELRLAGHTLPDGPQLLARAAQHVQMAEAALERRDFVDARQKSRDCLQLLRILQRAHWIEAVGSLSSPVASPHTVAFQSLPDHWRMVEQFGRSAGTAEPNLLRSGDFEDIHTMIVEGWKHTQSDVKGIRATAELYPADKQGKYALRLIAVPDAGTDPPTVVRQTSVAVTTPDLTVRSGQIVHVSGWIRMAAPVIGSLDGVMLYDSIGGPASAFRWHHKGDWRRFEIIREVHQSGTFNLTLALNGLGEVHLDDLQVIPHTPRAEPQLTQGPEQRPDPSAWQKSLEFWNRVPKLNPLAPRRPGGQ